MSESLMGVETEYSIAGFDRSGSRVDMSPLVSKFINVAQRERVTLPCAQSGGVFLANGARLYVDCGCHVEYSTPECLSPWDVLEHVAAGDLLMEQLAAAVSSEMSGVEEVHVYKNNVDYSGNRATWGCHESYLHDIPRSRKKAVAGQLIPHLVSRIIYAGAGGLNPLSPGLELSLSPRVHHLISPYASSSTDKRGIVHGKNEDLSHRRHSRLHLLCGESLCSHTASVLKVGATALVVALLGRNENAFDDLRLLRPVKDLHSITLDPHFRRTLKLLNGKRIKPVAMQQAILERVESNIGKGLPDWAEPLCALWRRTLEQLASGSKESNATLDWAIKFPFFREHMRRSGLGARQVNEWNGFVHRFLRFLRQRCLLREPTEILGLMLSHVEIHDRYGSHLTAMLAEEDREASEFDRFLTLRSELMRIDMNFSRLGEEGVFGALDRSGLLAHSLLGGDAARAAMTKAPRGTRAAVRGDEILRLDAGGNRRYFCSWELIYDKTENRWFDLADPFAQSAHWKTEGNPFQVGVGRRMEMIRGLSEHLERE